MLRPSLRTAGVSAPDARFISLMGSLTANSAYNPFEVVHALARKTGGQGFFLPVPFIADTREDHDVLVSQRSVQDALAIARQVTANRALDAALAQAHEQVKEGSGLGLALGQSKLFPRLALQMVQVGEEAGELDGMLLKVADTFELESRRSIDRLLAALVPALTVVMTVLVGFIMAAILLPLLSLTSNIQ